MSSPITTSTSATSSLHIAATIAATANHPQRRSRDAQYANSSGPIDTASGWKNSQTSHCDVGCNKIDDTEREREPSVVEAIAREQEHRARAARLRGDLHEQQEVRARTEPVERREQRTGSH